MDRTLPEFLVGAGARGGPSAACHATGCFLRCHFLPSFVLSHVACSAGVPACGGSVRSSSNPRSEETSHCEPDLRGNFRLLRGADDGGAGVASLCRLSLRVNGAGDLGREVSFPTGNGLPRRDGVRFLLPRSPLTRTGNEVAVDRLPSLVRTLYTLGGTRCAPSRRHALSRTALYN